MVEATTRHANVDAFIVCSACRIRAQSRMRSEIASGRSPLRHRRKLAACESDGSGST
jgi:hypothetical protein